MFKLFRKGRGTRDQIAHIHWIIEKAREFKKNIYFCFIDYAKVFDCADHTKLWEILQEMEIPDHLKEISPEYPLEGPMLRLKLQYFGHLMQRTDSLEKTLILGKLKVGREGEDRE